MNYSCYQGKVGLVTGSGAGMGRAMAIAFAAAGAKVLVTDVNVKGGKETVASIREAGGEAKFLRTDVANGRDVEAMVAAVVADYGRLDFAINNAGIDCEGALLADVDDKLFDKVIDVNLKGVFLCMKHEIRQMVKQGAGAIVNISSVNGFRPQPALSVYTAAKHAVIGITRNAAVDYAKAGVRINAICPGAIDTPMMQAGMDRYESPNFSREQVFSAFSLIGRPGMPEEIAKAALWLCSDESSYTYGHALAVDGGYLAR